MADKFKDIRAYRVAPLLAITDWITILPILKRFERKTTKSVKLAYLGERKQIEKDIKNGACFLTNHRDICMDAAWLSMLLRMRYFIRPYMGIGNNLFVKWWIEPLVRYLRCFVVIRNGSMHEQREHSITLSQYINHLRKKKKSIWLAQREGRAKDSNDLTQPGVIKMLTFEAEDFFERIKELNICPVSITYEFDPCDFLKAREMQLKRDNPNWRKSKADDLKSMQTGITGYKGRVTYRLTQSINPEIDQLLKEKPEVKDMNRNEQIQEVCQIIDRHIHAGYELYPHDEAFEKYIKGQVDKIKLSHKDEAFLSEKLHEMYDNPRKNYEKSHLCGQL